MSVVVWDGKSIAADRQQTCSGIATTAVKLWSVLRKDDLKPSICAVTGDMEKGLNLKEWYIAGEDPATWPTCNTKEDWCRLIVVRGGRVYFYELQPYAQYVHKDDKFMAWGSGRDLALGALAMGATAQKAVEIVCQFDIGCGRGVDIIHL